MLRHLCLFTALFAIFLPPEGTGQVIFQNSPDAPRSPSQNRYKVTGTVVNSVTGEPIGRAVVRVNGSTNQQMFTDGSGHFEASDVPEGQIVVTAQRPGFVNSQMNGVRFQRSQMIAVGPSMPSIEVKLMPEGFIRGKITNNEGEPVENVSVQVMFQQINNGRKDWLLRGGAQTDENGEYSIEDLPPGQYLLHTSTRPLFFVNTAAEGSPYTDVYPGQYFPNAPDRNSAQPVTVRPGQTAEADFRLSPAPSYSITGAISGPQNVTVICEDEEGNPLSFGGINHRTNQFRLVHIPAGPCTLTAHFQGANGEAYYAEQPITVNSSNITGVQLALQPLSDIPVHLPFSTHGIPVQLQLVSRQKHGRGRNQFYPMMEGSPSDHQTAIFKNVPPGSYQVVANSFNVCLAGLSSGGVDLLHEDLAVMSGAIQAAPIEVSLRDDCATLNGKIDASPMTNYSVVVISNSGGMQPKVANMAGNGFSFSGFTPGEYTVYAFSDISNLEYANPEVMREFSGQKITLSPGEKATLQLNVITRGDSQ